MTQSTSFFPKYVCPSGKGRAHISNTWVTSSPWRVCLFTGQITGQITERQLGISLKETELLPTYQPLSTHQNPCTFYYAFCLLMDELESTNFFKISLLLYLSPFNVALFCVTFRLTYKPPHSLWEAYKKSGERYIYSCLARLVFKQMYSGKMPQCEALFFQLSEKRQLLC